MGFIYKVTNNINNKVYIGKTLHNIEKRFNEHKWEAKTNAKGRPFHLALNKYGSENFSIEILEEVEFNKLNEKEIYWISFYNSYIGFPQSNGYNATLGGDGTIKSDYELIISDYLITKSKQQTAKNFNCCVETVRIACEIYGIKTINNSTGRKIQRIDENNNIQEYNSIKQAAEEISEKTDKNAQTIRKRITYVLNHDVTQRAYGYYWKLV